MINITVSQMSYIVLMNAIHAYYKTYTGNEAYDQEVYSFNSMLDVVIQEIKNNQKEIQ